MITDNRAAARIAPRRWRATNLLRITTVLAAVTALAIIGAASLAIHAAEAHARGPDPSGHVGFQPHAGDGAAAGVYVWASHMTMGISARPSAVYLGYMQGTTERSAQGTLNPTTFTHGDVDYEVRALALRQKNDGGQHLVFSTNKRLPDNLTLHIGDHRFAVSESMEMGIWGQVRVWSVQGDLGWTDGQTAYVALLEPTAEEIVPGEVCPPIPFGCIRAGAVKSGDPGS